MNPTDNQSENKPWLWKKGQSGNPAGRPKGKSMKDYVRTFLSKMTEEERDEFLAGIPKEIIWRMGEGNPKQDVDATHDLSDNLVSLVHHAIKGGGNSVPEQNKE